MRRTRSLYDCSRTTRLNAVKKDKKIEEEEQGGEEEEGEEQETGEIQ